MAEAPVRRTYQIYLYAVCFVAVIVLLFAGSQALFGVVRIALPEQTVADHGYYEPPVPVGEDGAAGFEDGLVFDPIDQERRRGVVELLRNGIVAAIAAGLFAFHWRRARRLRDEVEDMQAPRAEDVGQPNPPVQRPG
jgi:hypothetical protein